MDCIPFVVMAPLLPCGKRSLQEEQLPTHINAQHGLARTAFVVALNECDIVAIQYHKGKGEKMLESGRSE